MDALREEWDKLRAHDFQLHFAYPSDAEKTKLRLINVDPTPRQRAKEKRLQRQRDELIRAARSGDVDVQELIRDLQQATTKPSL
jgi:superfamily I DNA and RNA helicase